MKVLFLTNIPSPYRVDFFNELGKFCDLTVLYERQKAVNRDNKWKAKKNRNYKEVHLKGAKLTTDGALCLEVTKWLKRDKFDIFVVGGYSTPTGMLAIQILKVRRIPFILSSDGGMIKEDKKLLYKIKRYFISSASWWLSTGNTTSQYLQHYGAKKENIFTYPLTSIKDQEILVAPLKDKEKQKIRKEIGLPYEKIAISVGQFIERKGYDLLIDAWRNVDREWQLLIIGSGEEEKNFLDQIKRNKLKNIELIEFKQKEELMKYYLASDIFILPTREDIWGLVINEAMACGLPIITTDRCIAGIELVGTYKNGCIINLEDIIKINEIIKNINIKEKSQSSLLGIRKYTIEEMAKVHMEIFRVIIGSKG